MQIRNPSFFEAPPFWKSDWEEVNAFLDGLSPTEDREIGRSQGGRPIRAVAYGEKEPIHRTNNRFSAQLARRTDEFFDPKKRTRPVMVVISTIHGGETEGCATCLNYAHLIESGADLRGRRWEDLRALTAEARVVLVPLAQPDGRIRAAVRHLVGGTPADMLYYGQGEPREKLPEPPTWEWFLRHNPIPLDLVSYLGGYYNDAGVNIDLDDFLSPGMAPETAALLALVRDECPDCVLVLHAHGPGPWISAPKAFVPRNIQFHQAQVGALVADRHRREGLRPAWRAPSGTVDTPYFDFPTALHHVSGSLPLAFEFPHGLVTHPYTFDEILDIGLTLFEESLRYATTWRHILWR
ncbi:MAG: hypothetical protein HY321_14075 [Armatimonadetes bacterium]|nr:hypothetical protein [Armatimonadota bacterium]